MERIKRLEATVSRMLAEKKGSSWREVECGLHNAVETYCGDVRTAEMLNQGMARLRELQSVQLRASNPHELGRCFEVGFLLTNAEMVMRASLGRKESRRHPLPFRRADFPEQDDANWFVFSALSLENGRYRFEKIPIL